MTLEMAAKSKANGIKPFFGPDWIRIEKPSELIERNNSFSRLLAFGLMGGLVLGTGVALIADRRSNRVFSQADLLCRLGHPLAPWFARCSMDFSGRAGFGGSIGHWAGPNVVLEGVEYCPSA